MNWALKRQIFYIIFLVLFFGGFGYLVIYPSLIKDPTCTDNVQNGNEKGIDCGGFCAKACIDDVQSLSVLWARSFKVVHGRYNAVAYFTNHNKNVGIQKINYKFRFADERNVYLGKREGSTFIPPSGNFAVFEPGIDVGNYVPTYTTFEFTQTPLWLQISEEKINQLKVAVSNIELKDENTNPKLSATIKNNSLFIIPSLSVVVILYDALNNAVSASRTHVTELSQLQSADINFTWQEPFSTPVVSKEVIPMYDFFSVRLK